MYQYEISVSFLPFSISLFIVFPIGQSGRIGKVPPGRTVVCGLLAPWKAEGFGRGEGIKSGTLVAGSIRKGRGQQNLGDSDH